MLVFIKGKTLFNALPSDTHDKSYYKFLLTKKGSLVLRHPLVSIVH